MIGIEAPGRLLLGLITGIVFGFLLHRSGVSKYATITGQFLLRDFTMMKMMMTAIIVGGAGAYAMHGLGWVDLTIKPMLMGGVIVGALVFGVAMAVLGYCPGTAVAACAEGRKDALMGVAGMLAGSMVYAEMFPWLKATVLSWPDKGKITLPETIGAPWWVFFLVLAAAAWLLFSWLGRKGLDEGVKG
ncbi:MAG TPA: YeeE/YedE thiosulfate transporter family protein [Bryobacteraceae bacterium]|nr:YeeE/YedE thiosulfate transporter family protein [Bryobacteraceae bacterium]HPT25461.1 YeeE/YedE thiosulfate transporter family protein [Bryobacteraceae bacterium]